MSADPGYYGPGSVTWRIMGDPAMGVGGLRAIILQALHPLAMHGVAKFSGYEDDPWGRLQRTAGYLGATTYGTKEQAEAAAAKVRSIHDRLSARPQVEPTTGRRYRVNDQDLLRWVHATEMDSFLAVAQRGFGLSDDDADRFLREQQVAARLIGIEPGTAPASLAELRDYLERVRPQLRATPASRRTIVFGLLPPMKPWVALFTPARPAWLGLEALAFSLLPRWARRMHGLPGVVTTDASATLALRTFRAAVGRVPEAKREGPFRAAARERLGLESAFA